MKRRNFLLASTGLIFLSVEQATAKEDVCMTGLEGIDVESNVAVGFSHYHQLIISVSDLVRPPRKGIQLLTSVMDQGSFDQLGMEAFARSSNLGIEALRTHDHNVDISYEVLRRIASGEKNVEIAVYPRDEKAVFARDEKTYVHNFLVTAPPSALAIVEKESKK